MGMAVPHGVLLVLLVGAACVAAGSREYYDRLGVAQDASTRDIRRAFKKLALEKHPDKNPQDPHAHAEFVRINTAFEVLKDEELRRKYDAHGEAGLGDGFHGGDGFQGWQHYNEDFGLYDEDPQIETLGHHEFFSAVLHTDDLWLVNFYSPGCSHCHDLAPAWRELGTALAGIIGVGAVNCHEQWQLCNQMGIQGYPTLMLFGRSGQGSRYDGPRDVQSLLEYAASAAAEVPMAGDEDLAAFVGAGRPFAAAVCVPWEAECLYRDIKLLGLGLADRLPLVFLDCGVDRTLCEARGFSEPHIRLFSASGESTRVYPPSGADFDTWSPGAAARALFAAMPGPAMIDGESFSALVVDGALVPGQAAPVLVAFVGAHCPDCDEALLVLRTARLPGGTTIKQYTCPDSSVCSVYFHEPYTLALFKWSGYEVLHEPLRRGALEKWVEAGLSSQSTTLDPTTFASRVQAGHDTWFVDFYAPWCPPCREMLPPFRAASGVRTDVRFATVDCARYPGLCQANGIGSYPTLVLYRPGTPPQQYFGGPDGPSMTRFIDDILNPVVIALTPDTFRSLILDGTSLALVDFYAPWCGHCQHLEPQLRDAARVLAGTVVVGKLDCQAHSYFCQEQGIGYYPTLRIYPAIRRGQLRSVQLYQGHLFAAAIIAGLSAHFPTQVQAVHPQEFSRTIETSAQPWLLSFGAPWCQPCHNFQPYFAVVAARLHKHGFKAGYMDCQASGHLCHSLGIPHYPYVMLFSRDARLQTDMQDPDELVRWAMSHVPVRDEL
eukprot:m.165786 g.165786  ORF g.165786 m.165786 type:complete len:774 (-) comp9896_c1_seq2:89-2410(-)